MQIAVEQDQRVCLYTWRAQSLFCISFLGAKPNYKPEPTSQVEQPEDDGEIWYYNNGLLRTTWEREAGAQPHTLQTEII